MKILKRAGQPQPTKLQKRISGIGTPELVIWAENSLSTIGRNIVHHQRDGIAALKEAQLGAEVLLAITEELIKRSNDA
jgi:hypothetical protein